MTGSSADTDRLEPLRDQLEAIDQVTVDERAALFDRANRALVSELDALGEV